MEDLKEVESSEMRGMFSKCSELVALEDPIAVRTILKDHDEKMKIMPIWMRKILDELCISGYERFEMNTSCDLCCKLFAIVVSYRYDTSERKYTSGVRHRVTVSRPCTSCLVSRE